MHLGYEVFHPDLAALVDFYVRILGFNPHRELKTDDDHAVVRRDDVDIGCTRHPEADTAARKPPHGSEIVLRVDDIRLEHQRVVSSGWPIEDELEERPWGLKDFRVFDPSGQYIRITTSYPSTPGR